MMQKILIRRATASDASILPAVERSAAEAFRSVEGLEWVADDSVLSEEAQSAWISKGCVLVAEGSEGHVLGFVIVEGVGDVFHIWELAVRSGAQRSGLGTRLMKQAEETALENNGSALTLTTFRDLSFNEKFYVQLGFKVLESVDLDARLKGILVSEAKHGLPSERRCAMRKQLEKLDGRS